MAIMYENPTDSVEPISGVFLGFWDLYAQTLVWILVHLIRGDRGRHIFDPLRTKFTKF